VNAHSVQAYVSQRLAADERPRRRSVPPSLSTSMSQSLNERWRERPRRPALPVAPERRDGVVHAIAGRVTGRDHARPVHAGRTRRPRAHVRVRIRRHKAASDSITDRFASVAVLSRRNVAFIKSDLVPCTIASLMLVPCSASSMLFASLRPGRRPGLRALTTPARGTDWQWRDGDHCDGRSREVDEDRTQAYCKFITPVPPGTPPVRHNGIRSAQLADAPRARFRAHPSRHRSP
jgi:hypothetical protein